MPDERRPRLGSDRYMWDCYGDMQDAYTPLSRKRVKQIVERAAQEREGAQTQREVEAHGTHGTSKRRR